MKHNNSIILKGYIFAIFSAVIYGCMPLMAKYIYDDGVNPFTLVFLRNFFSLIPLALLALREKKSLRIDAKSLPMISSIRLVMLLVKTLKVALKRFLREQPLRFLYAQVIDLML
jgi:drug/metabolite transporter (DMT)-like permease